MKVSEMLNLAVGDTIIRFSVGDPQSHILRLVTGVYRDAIGMPQRVETEALESTGHYKLATIYTDLSPESLVHYKMLRSNIVKVSSLNYVDRADLSHEDKLIIKEYMNGCC